MGVSPHNSVITVEFECQFKVHLKDGSLGAILSAFCKLMPQIIYAVMMRSLSGRQGMGKIQRYSLCFSG